MPKPHAFDNIDAARAAVFDPPDFNCLVLSPVAALGA
jgi:hypothetical protein